MPTDINDQEAGQGPAVSETQTSMKRPPPPITILSPQHDGNRDALIAALAAAVVAIARRQAASASAMTRETKEPGAGTVRTI